MFCLSHVSPNLSSNLCSADFIEGFSTISSRVLVFLYSSDQSSSLCFDELEVFFHYLRVSLPSVVCA